MIPDSVLEATPGLALVPRPCEFCGGQGGGVTPSGDIQGCHACGGSGKVEGWELLRAYEWERAEFLAMEDGSVRLEGAA